MIALKNSKIILGFCALVAAIALMSVGVTLAAWTASTRETNVLTLGNVDISLNEYYEENDSVLPGVDVVKKVWVTNTGDNDCYVRVLVKKSWDEQSGRTTPSTDWIIPTYNTAYWKRAAVEPYEGYECWYYKDILAPGDEAKPLFENFQLDAEHFDIDTYGNFTGHIIVKAEAVQSDNYTPTKAGGYVTAWPGVTIQ